jgi:hypothetical protein
VADHDVAKLDGTLRLGRLCLDVSRRRIIAVSMGHDLARLGVVMTRFARTARYGWFKRREGRAIRRNIINHTRRPPFPLPGS